MIQARRDVEFHLKPSEKTDINFFVLSAFFAVQSILSVVDWSDAARLVNGLSRFRKIERDLLSGVLLE